MGGLFGGSSKVAPAPPPAPTVDNQQAAMDAAAAAARDRATRGRASTILTGGQGVDSSNTKIKTNDLLGGS